MQAQENALETIPNGPYPATLETVPSPLDFLSAFFVLIKTSLNPHTIDWGRGRPVSRPIQLTGGKALLAGTAMTGENDC